MRAEWRTGAIRSSTPLVVEHRRVHGALAHRLSSDVTSISLLLFLFDVGMTQCLVNILPSRREKLITSSHMAIYNGHKVEIGNGVSQLWWLKK
jgi:hypothetical protein